MESGTFCDALKAPATDGALYELVCDKPVLASFVKLSLSKADADYLILPEVEVYGERLKEGMS